MYQTTSNKDKEEMKKGKMWKMYVTIYDLKQYMSLCHQKGEGKENVNISTMWEEKTWLTTFIEGDNKVRVP